MRQTALKHPTSKPFEHNESFAIKAHLQDGTSGSVTWLPGCKVTTGGPPNTFQQFAGAWNLFTGLSFLRLGLLLTEGLRCSWKELPVAPPEAHALTSMEAELEGK